MGGSQNYGPFLGLLNTRCRIILRTHKGTIILTTTHMCTQVVDLDPLGLSRGDPIALSRLGVDADAVALNSAMAACATRQTPGSGSLVGASES